MQIILLDKVANLGNLGDVVKVRAGYARNFLIPQHMAKRAGATITNVPASHALYLTHPGAVADVIVTAAQDAGSAR